MTEKVQARHAHSRKAVIVRCCLKSIHSVKHRLACFTAFLGGLCPHRSFILVFLLYFLGDNFVFKYIQNR